jgi:hypothetical protein
MKIRIYMLVMSLVFLGVNTNQQLAHAEPPSILWSELTHVMNGVEMNFQNPYLWMRYSVLMRPNDTVKTRLCYKMDTRRIAFPANSWTSTFNYVLYNWTPYYITMSDPEAAWCWQ